MKSLLTAFIAVVCVLLAFCTYQGLKPDREAEALVSSLNVAAQKLSTALLGADAVISANLRRVTVAWDPPTLNADGTPCTDLAEYEVAVSLAAQDMNNGGTAIATMKVPKSTTQLKLSEMFGGSPPVPIPQGPLRVWARAWDTSGNASTWSDPLSIINDEIPPAKLTIRITIEVQT